MFDITHQFAYFVAAGILTTLLDFSVYNGLTRAPFNWSRIRANCVSVTVAIAFSFTVNMFLVFQPEHIHVLERGWKFLAVTAFSAYVLQNSIIYLTSRRWLWPVQTALWLARSNRISARLNDDFIKKNTVKLCAVVTGLAWNFLWYRYYVFSK